jgi:hypothetical protein
MLEKIAYYLGRNNEEPNIALAIELCKTDDAEGIEEIAHGLWNENEQIASDCIKVLYETGYRKPELIAEYVFDFIKLLKSKNNRLIWGAMTALSAITSRKPKEVFTNLDTVIDAFKKGSVITRDCCVSVFAELAKADKAYERVIFPVIIEHLRTCRPKEIGQHAERAFICVNKNNAEEFSAVLKERRVFVTDAQKKRLDKLIMKIEKGQYKL